MTVSWRDLYFFGIRLGYASVRKGNYDLGLRSIMNPVRSGFNRYFEAPYAINMLRLKSSDLVLDISSPKHVALFVRSAFGCGLTSTDIVSDYLEPYKRYAKDVGIEGISWDVQDARRLTYGDNTFDKAYSISVLEHISDDGDILASGEIGRVLKPGGLLTVTVPYSDPYGEIFRDEAVYERGYAGRPVFFSRLYDDKSLLERLILPSGLRETDRVYYEARWGIEKGFERLPRFIQMPLHWSGPFLVKLAYRRVSAARPGASGFCCLTLRKDG